MRERESTWEQKAAPPSEEHAMVSYAMLNQLMKETFSDFRRKSTLKVCDKKVAGSNPGAGKGIFSYSSFKVP